MTMTRTLAHLGDFLNQARHHLAEAQSAAQAAVVTPIVLRRTTAEVHQLLATLGRYTDGIWWLPELGQPLQQAAAALSRAWVAPQSFEPDHRGVDHRLPDRLAACAKAWGLGADLLAGHLRAGMAGPLGGRSDWTHLLYQRRVQRTAGFEVATAAMDLARLLEHLASEHPDSGDALGQAARRLDTPAVRAATADGESAGERLLAGIPMHAVTPLNPPPAYAQPVPDLLADATADARALCTLARLPDGDLPVAAHWRHSAGQAVIAAHLLIQANQMLADRAHELYGTGADGRVIPLRRMFDQMVELKQDWRRVHALWGTVTTGTAREADRQRSPRLLVFRHLTIRLGRLVHQNPLWTPERREASPYRAPSGLVPTATALPAALSTVVHCVEALAAIAARDDHAVQQQHGHLFALSRTGAKLTYDPLATHPAFGQLRGSYRTAEKRASTLIGRALWLFDHLCRETGIEVATEVQTLRGRRRPAGEPGLSPRYLREGQPVWALGPTPPPLPGARLLIPGAVLAQDDFPAPLTPRTASTAEQHDQTAEDATTPESQETVHREASVRATPSRSRMCP